MIINDQPTSKEQAFKLIETKLKQTGISIQSKDMNRPWGGFFVIDQSSLTKFLSEYFDSRQLPKQIDNLTLSPKILIVEPEKRLSWQYHYRRSEIWSVIKGPVGVIKSENDSQGNLIILKDKDQIELQEGERHRLVGLTDWGVIAEIWQHSDPDHPSDEDDIVRLEDDFGR